MAKYLCPVVWVKNFIYEAYKICNNNVDEKFFYNPIMGKFS